MRTIPNLLRLNQAGIDEQQGILKGSTLLIENWDAKPH